MEPSGPEFERQRMVAPVPAGNLPQDRRADAEMFAPGGDAEAALALSVSRTAQRAQLGDDLRGRVHVRARRARTAPAISASTGAVWSNERHGSVMLRP